MTTDFKLVGLNRVANNDIVATLEPIDKEETFKASLKCEPELKESLWNYCSHDWKNKKLAVVEHAGFYSNGHPINPVVTYIKHLD